MGPYVFFISAIFAFIGYTFGFSSALFIVWAFTLIGTFFYWYGKQDRSTSINAKVKELTNEDNDVYAMFFDVVGESFKNDDGISRQEIIKKYARVQDPIHLKFYDYKGSMACGVYLDENHAMQIGNISRDEVKEVYDLATSGSTIDPRIYSMGKGQKGLYGVVIEILIKDD